VQRDYEVMYIIDPELDEEGTSEIISRFKALVEKSAEVVAIDEWGKRRLAYPINFKNEGYYVLMNFRSEPDFPRELERNFKISDSIIKSMIIKVEKKS
jgi:small subunit ribosomal protein S6